MNDRHQTGTSDILLLPRLTTDQDKTPRTQHGCATDSPWITTYHHGPITDYAGLSQSITDPLQFKPDQHGCTMNTLQMLPFRRDCTTIEANIQPDSTYERGRDPGSFNLTSRTQEKGTRRTCGHRSTTKKAAKTSQCVDATMADVTPGSICMPSSRAPERRCTRVQELSMDRL